MAGIRQLPFRIKRMSVWVQALSLGFERESNSGGLDWTSSSWSGSADKYSISRENGLGFDIGLFIGISVSHLENIINFFIPCAQ
jgi:hypothetical protein